MFSSFPENYFMICRLLILLVLFCLRTSSLFAHDVTSLPTVETSGTSPTETLWLPPGDLYAPYAADVHRVGFSFHIFHYTRSMIPHTGNDRSDVKAGGRFGFARGQWHGLTAWQLSGEIGVNAQFDLDQALDNIGWDGKYGILLTTAPRQDLSYKIMLSHDSSHVGDEFEERTGMRRIGYTRHELAGGFSWLMDERWRLYSEAAWGFLMGNDRLQKPGRFQVGGEWQPADFRINGRRGWYAGLDLSSMQERDWLIDASFQAGYRIDCNGKIWRFGLEVYSGRPLIGEFFQYTERFFGIGASIDI